MRVQGAQRVLFNTLNYYNTMPNCYAEVEKHYFTPKKIISLLLLATKCVDNLTKHLIG